jgi:hypothetical protein
MLTALTICQMRVSLSAATTIATRSPESKPAKAAKNVFAAQSHRVTASLSVHPRAGLGQVIVTANSLTEQRSLLGCPIGARTSAAALVGDDRYQRSHGFESKNRSGSTCLACRSIGRILSAVVLARKPLHLSIRSECLRKCLTLCESLTCLTKLPSATQRWAGKN